MYYFPSLRLLQWELPIVTIVTMRTFHHYVHCDCYMIYNRVQAFVKLTPGHNTTQTCLMLTKKVVTCYSIVY